MTQPLELKDFISGVLTNIAEGISSANSYVAGRTEYTNPVFVLSMTTRGSEKEKIAMKGVEFDVAIAAVNEKTKGGGISISVPIIGEIGAGGSFDTTNHQSHRIKFNISIEQDISSLKPKIDNTSS